MYVCVWKRPLYKITCSPSDDDDNLPNGYFNNVRTEKRFSHLITKQYTIGYMGVDWLYAWGSIGYMAVKYGVSTNDLPFIHDSSIEVLL